jgi:hypothetical protein
MNLTALKSVVQQEDKVDENVSTGSPYGTRFLCVLRSNSNIASLSENSISFEKKVKRETTNISNSTIEENFGAVYLINVVEFGPFCF